MDLKRIKNSLGEITLIVEGWQADIPEIERDCALAKLRTLYEDVKAARTVATIREVPAATPVEATVAVPVEKPVATPVEAPVEVSGPGEDNSCGDEPKEERQKPDRKALMSLYGDDAGQEKRPLLGEVIANGVTTLGDTLARERCDDVASRLKSEMVDSLRGATGVNDKFLMIRDLFGGDQSQYEAAMECFESFTSLDDAMLHIYENYTWDPDSEGVRLLVDLLTRKLS